MNQKERTFVDELWTFYASHARTLPWRLLEPGGSIDPYKILVSELMLQQTQVKRVLPKYIEFIERFPDFYALASTQLADVITVWSGLGYNRRAKYLHDISIQLIEINFPHTIEGLTAFKGVGFNTAAAILTYAFNQPYVYIETNIRTVYLHHFFEGSTDVSDLELIPIIERTLDIQNPRDFMWAVMDYGTFLKAKGLNNLERSKHYVKQSRFEGSIRQMRGEILRQALKNPAIDSISVSSDTRFKIALAGLITDGLVVVDNRRLQITK